MKELTKEKTELNKLIKKHDDILSDMRILYKKDLNKFSKSFDIISDHDRNFISLMAILIKVELKINDLELQINCKNV